MIQIVACEPKAGMRSKGGPCRGSQAGAWEPDENAAFNFLGGYVVTDVSGDRFVDATDVAIADNNALNYVSVQRP